MSESPGTARRLGPGRRALLGPGLGIALAAFASSARAHAPPLAARVLVHPSGGEDVIVTNRGLVFRDPRSGAARLLCNEALRLTTAEVPDVTFQADGALLVASSSGLRLSHDQGCSWADVGGMATTNTPALASPASDADTVIVASYAAERSGLLVTRDGGLEWAMAVPTSESDYVHSLLVASADPGHVYATLTRFEAAQAPAHALLRSVDGGRTWERRPLPIDERDYSALAAATDPDDPTRLALYTVANSPGLDDARLLVSSDAGDSFEVMLARPEIRGADYDAEGRLWVAARDGLYRGDAAGFERVSAASELGCVRSLASGLLVCGHYAGVDAARSGVGISRDAGQSFEALLDFNRVESPVMCEDGSLTAALCAQPWLDWQAELLGAPPAARGPSGAAPLGDAPPAEDGAASDAEATTEPRELVPAVATADGCGLSPARAPSSTLPALSSGLLLALMRRLGRRLARETSRRRSDAGYSRLPIGTRRDR
jgi:hypothetical protein